MSKHFIPIEQGIYLYYILIYYMYYYNLLVSVVYHKNQQDLSSQSGVNSSSQSFTDLCLGLSPNGWYLVTVPKGPLFKVSLTDSSESRLSHTVRVDLYPSVYPICSRGILMKLTGLFNDLQEDHNFYEVN